MTSLFEISTVQMIVKTFAQKLRTLIKFKVNLIDFVYTIHVTIIVINNV